MSAGDERAGGLDLRGLEEMPEITDFSSAMKNPFAEGIKKDGYSITCARSAWSRAGISTTRRTFCSRT